MLGRVSVGPRLRSCHNGPAGREQCMKALLKWGPLFSGILHRAFKKELSGGPPGLESPLRGESILPVVGLVQDFCPGRLGTVLTMNVGREGVASHCYNTINIIALPYSRYCKLTQIQGTIPEHE